MRCANCTTDAVWLFDDRGAAPQYFCKTHLPLFLHKRAKAGALKRAVEDLTVEEPPAEVTDVPLQEAPKPKKKKKKPSADSTDTD